MKERTQNVAVGLTVLVALVLLGGLIMFFAGLPWLVQQGYEIRIAADTTHDAHPGDGIHLAGMRVGRVTDVGFTDPTDPYAGITITARIEQDIKLPGSVVAEFYTKGLVGAAYIELKPTGPARLDPDTGEPLEFFPTDGSLIMASRHIGTSVVPQELTDAMKSMTELADNINELLKPTVTEGTTIAPGTQVPEPAGLRATVDKLNAVLDAMVAVLGDVDNQQNLKTSLANLAKATETAAATMEDLQAFAQKAGTTAEDFSELARKAAGSADQISRLMATANRLATSIETGEGTAGMLLNDPKLYNSFLQATTQMNDMMAELQILIDQWRQQGVKIDIE